MAVDSVSNSPYLSDVAPRVPTSKLGKDEFLKLLTTQLQYQDPLQPMDNTQYIAQMAQLSTLEQTTNMSNSFDAMQSFQLVGKNVTATVQAQAIGETEQISGKVDKVIKDGSNILLVIGERQIKLSDIQEVSDSATTN